jgi:hypothetical protein
MKVLSVLFVAASLLLTATGCSKQKDDNMLMLVGKWRSEKTDPAELIEAMKKAPGAPPHMIQPMIDKIKKGAELTSDWEFNADGSAKFGQTGKPLMPVTWRILRTSGAKSVLELNWETPEKSTWEVVFAGNDRFSMRSLGEGDDGPPVVLTRIP